MRLKTTFASFATFCVAAAAVADPLDGVLSRIDRAASGFKSMTASIRRVSHTAVINEDNVNIGTMTLKKSKARDMRMLVELTAPDEKAVAVQGRKLELYFPKIQTVQEYDLGKNRELLDQFFLLGFSTSSEELKAAYTLRLLDEGKPGEEKVAGEKTAHLELIPKSKEVLQHLKKFELWVGDNGYPAQQKFFLPAGDYMLVTYTNMKVNHDVPDSALNLKLPKRVKREFPQK